MPLPPSKDFANLAPPTNQTFSPAEKSRSKQAVEAKAEADRAEREAVIKHSLALASLPPLSASQKKDPRTVEGRCKLYFNYAAQFNVQPTVEGLALALSTSRTHLLKVNRENAWGSEVSAILEKYLAAINTSLTTLTLSGKIYANYVSFLQKNNAGYVDKAEVTIEAGDSLLTRDDLIKRADALDAEQNTIEADFAEKPQNAQNTESAERRPRSVVGK